MYSTYSPDIDALAVVLDEGHVGARTEMRGPDLGLDFAEDGHLVAIEVLNASRYYDRAALEQLGSPVRFLSLTEAAKESGLTPATLRVLLNRGRLAGEKRGRDWFVAHHELWNYLESRSAGGRPAVTKKGRAVRRKTQKAAAARSAREG